MQLSKNTGCESAARGSEPCVSVFSSLKERSCGSSRSTLWWPPHSRTSSAASSPPSLAAETPSGPPSTPSPRKSVATPHPSQISGSFGNPLKLYYSWPKHSNLHGILSSPPPALIGGPAAEWHPPCPGHSRADEDPGGCGEAGLGQSETFSDLGLCYEEQRTMQRREESDTVE